MIRIICVGKIKEQYLKELIEDYYKRINKYHNVEIIELKDFSNEGEAEAICRAVKHLIENSVKPKGVSSN